MNSGLTLIDTLTILFFFCFAMQMSYFFLIVFRGWIYAKWTI